MRLSAGQSSLRSAQPSIQTESVARTECAESPLWSLLSESPAAEAGPTIEKCFDQKHILQAESEGVSSARGTELKDLDESSELVSRRRGADEDAVHSSKVGSPSSGDGGTSTDQLRKTLELALQKISSLEERLDAQELGRDPPLLHDRPSLDDLPKSTSDKSVAGGPAAAPHLHKPFIFEEYRRAHSQQLQRERHRVLVPPDSVPMWPHFPWMS